jgi:hypothetical protein
MPFRWIQVLDSLLDQLIKQGEEMRGIHTSANLLEYLKELLAFEGELQSLSICNCPSPA